MIHIPIVHSSGMDDDLPVEICVILGLFIASFVNAAFALSRIV